MSIPLNSVPVNSLPVGSFPYESGGTVSAVLYLLEGEIRFKYIETLGGLILAEETLSGNINNNILVQFSEGRVRFSHNFNYKSGDIAVVNYKTPKRSVGTLPSVSFDGDYLVFEIPEGLLNYTGIYSFSAKITAIRNGVTSKIPSEKFEIEIEDGVYSGV